MSQMQMRIEDPVTITRPSFFAGASAHVQQIAQITAQQRWLAGTRELFPCSPKLRQFTTSTFSRSGCRL